MFLLENVEMGKKWEAVLSEAVGIHGVHINSALVSAQNRKRIYWSNIRVREEGLFGYKYTDIPQPADRGILPRDILEKEVDEKKQGVFKRIWEAIKNLFRKFIEWIKRLFTRAKSLKEQLKQIEKKAARCKYPLEVSGLLTSELMEEITNHISRFDLYFTGTLSRRIQSHDEFLKRVENDISTEHKEEFKTTQDVINRSRDFQDYLSEIPHYQEALESQIANLREAFHVNSDTAMDELLELTKYKILVCKKSMEAVTISAQRLISAIDKAQE